MSIAGDNSSASCPRSCGVTGFRRRDLQASDKFAGVVEVFNDILLVGIWPQVNLDEVTVWQLEEMAHIRQEWNVGFFHGLFSGKVFTDGVA